MNRRALLLVAVAVLVLALSPVWDFDVWFHLASGKAIVAAGGLPAHDLFSFTAPDGPWDEHEWLSQLLSYLVFLVGGMTLVTASKALIAVVTFTLLWKHATEREADPWIAVAAVVWAAFTLRFFLVERPQVISQAFFAFQLFWLARGGTPWAFVPLAAAWANLHGGSSLLAPGVFGLWSAGAMVERRRAGEALGPFLRANVPAGVATLGALVLNPLGFRIFVYPFETMADRPYMAQVREWAPPTLSGQPGFFVFVAVAAVLVLVAWRRWRWPDLFVAAAFTYLAFGSRRHIALCVIAIAPVLASALSHALRRAPALSPRVALALGLAAGAGFPAVAVSRGEALSLRLRDDLYPAGAVERLTVAKGAFSADEPVRVFNLHRWGGYVLWHLEPEFRVFIDGRQMTYGPKVFADYYEILENRPGAGALLARYDPDVFLLNYGSAIGRRLALDPRVDLVYWDDTCMVYARQDGRGARLIAGHAYRAVHPERGVLADPAMALAELARAVEEAPTHARPVAMRAQVLFSIGRVDEAWVDAEKALERAPDQPPALLLAAEIARARGDQARAAELRLRAERLAPP